MLGAPILSSKDTGRENMKKVINCLWCNSQKLHMFARRKDNVAIVKCQDCRLVMNQEIPENPTEYYQEDYFNALEASENKGYEGAYYLVSPAFLLWQNSFIEQTNVRRTRKSFLEIGAATGNLLEILAENQTHMLLSGIDVSEYAVDIAKQKGFDVQVTQIENYKSEQKKDVIFSSETMEHLDNLKSFLKGVATNLKDDGVFLFYVPSISEQDAEKQADDYVRFNVNLEHLLHFSPEFFRNELPNFFKADVLIKEFKTSFGPSIVGAVSKNKDNLRDLEKLFSALDNSDLPHGSSDTALKNLAIFSLKFGNFELADQIFVEIDKRSKITQQDHALLRGLSSYHKGELEKAGTYFQEYIKVSPKSRVAIQLLLCNERELNAIYRDELQKKQEEMTKIKTRVRAVEQELSNLKNSKIVGGTIKLREAAGKTLGVARSSEKGKG